MFKRQHLIQCLQSSNNVRGHVEADRYEVIVSDEKRHNREPWRTPQLCLMIAWQQTLSKVRIRQTMHEAGMTNPLACPCPVVLSFWLYDMLSFYLSSFSWVGGSMFGTVILLNLLACGFCDVQGRTNATSSDSDGVLVRVQIPPVSGRVGT